MISKWGSMIKLIVRIVFCMLLNIIIIIWQLMSIQLKIMIMRHQVKSTLTAGSDRPKINSLILIHREVRIQVCLFFLKKRNLRNKGRLPSNSRNRCHKHWQTRQLRPIYHRQRHLKEKISYHIHRYLKSRKTISIIEI